MSRLDDLPPDQRAVLLLLVQQGKSHAEIADMLAIPESAVRERAHAGLEALAGGPVSAGGASRPRSEVRSRAPATPPPAGSPPPAGNPPLAERPPRAGRVYPPARSTAGPSSSTASRRAGALLLGAIVVVIVVVVLLVSGGGSAHKSSSSSTTTGNSTTSTAAGEPHIDKQLNLISPDPASKAVGLVEVLSQGSKRAFLVTAEHLPPSENGSFYAAWLYNSASDARVLGRAPNVSSNGQLQAVGSLPSNAGHFHQMLITRETTTKPSHPGPIVLNGPFSLH
ncbi:MAG TPA: sigma factor-like helix-turn-helix DNA-binding protein [Solirubrobacteraceae bacterium]|nr:sigma factor-like helix-turn-helix DNA-binding protein [Solirubrobacteraceae bacterium]